MTTLSASANPVVLRPDRRSWRLRTASGSTPGCRQCLRCWEVLCMSRRRSTIELTTPWLTTTPTTRGPPRRRQRRHRASGWSPRPLRSTRDCTALSPATSKGVFSTCTCGQLRQVRPSLPAPYPLGGRRPPLPPAAFPTTPQQQGETRPAAAGEVVSSERPRRLQSLRSRNFISVSTALLFC